MKEIFSSSKHLVKNPLGIIGLFIVLVYGFACLVLATGVGTLTETQKGLIVCFIVFFPVLILAAFYRLVTKHHKKLYAPTDYKDERLFFESMSEDQILDKVKSSYIGSRVENESEIKGADNLINIPNKKDQPSYVNAEKLALIKIEKEIGFPIHKYVKLKVNNEELTFDGFLETKVATHFVEVKFTQSAPINKEMIEATLYRAKKFIDTNFMNAINGRRYIIWLVIITDIETGDSSQIKREMIESFNIENIIVNTRFYKYKDLVG